MSYQNQLHISTLRYLSMHRINEYFEEIFKSENLQMTKEHSLKPIGFWTSTLTETEKSEWELYQKANIAKDSNDILYKHKLVVRKTANIYHVNLSNYKKFIRRYVNRITRNKVTLALHNKHQKRKNSYDDTDKYIYVINQGKLITDGYDGLHLEKYIPAYNSILVNNKAFKKYLLTFQRWDCESTVFWNNVFEEDIIPLGMV